MTGRSRAAIALAVLAYSLWSALLIRQNPGLQYDEALLVLGSVHMRHSRAELTLPHDPDTWICPGKRCYPLMTVRYVGAVKEYLCRPLYAWFGTGAAVLRSLNLVLGALAVAGVGALAGPGAAWILALNPSFVDLTIFDNGTVAVWMGVFGLLCFAIARYTARASLLSAFGVGFGMGLGIWARANFAWLLMAGLVAAAVVLRKKMLRPVPHWAAWVGGGILGGLPFLVYQVVSRGGTLQAVGMFSSTEPLGQRVAARLLMLGETLISDREHRAIWGGPMLPGWQIWLIALMALAGCLIALATKQQPIAQVAALTLILLGVQLITSNLPVAEHHLVVLLPLVAIAVAGAAKSIPSRYAVAAAAIVYLGLSVYWLGSAVQGIGRTGGVGQWSDAIAALSTRLQTQYPNREITILDWGLQNNLYVLSDARIHSREVYWAPGETRVEPAAWHEQLRRGGVFVLNAPENRFFPEATNLFRAQLAEDRPKTRRFGLNQRSGAPFAEVVEVEPDTLGQAPATGEMRTTLNLTDPNSEAQLEGFYPVEGQRWRWTKRTFAITMPVPTQARERGARLSVDVYVPEDKPLRLEVRVGDRLLATQMFPTKGQYTFAAAIPAGLLGAGDQRFHFALDHTVEGNSADKRELGIIVSKAVLSRQ